MRVSRAKRRLRRWERYITATGSHTSRNSYLRLHQAHILAYDAVARAKRYAPIGLREPWAPVTTRSVGRRA